MDETPEGYHNPLRGNLLRFEINLDSKQTIRKILKDSLQQCLPIPSEEKFADKNKPLLSEASSLFFKFGINILSPVVGRGISLLEENQISQTQSLFSEDIEQIQSQIAQLEHSIPNLQLLNEVKNLEAMLAKYLTQRSKPDSLIVKEFASSKTDAMQIFTKQTEKKTTNVITNETSSSNPKQIQKQQNVKQATEELEKLRAEKNRIEALYNTAFKKYLLQYDIDYNEITHQEDLEKISPEVLAKKKEKIITELSAYINYVRLQQQLKYAQTYQFPVIKNKKNDFWIAMLCTMTFTGITLAGHFAKKAVPLYQGMTHKFFPNANNWTKNELINTLLQDYVMITFLTIFTLIIWNGIQSQYTYKPSDKKDQARSRLLVFGGSLGQSIMGDAFSNGVNLWFYRNFKSPPDENELLLSHNLLAEESAYPLHELPDRNILSS